MAKQVPLPKKYPIPANWHWDDMGSFVQIKSGYPFDSKRFSSKSEGMRPLIRIRDVLKGETITFTDEDCPEEYIIHAGEILIGMDGDFNIAKWQSEDALLNQRVCCIKSKSELLLDNFLYYYLPSPLKKINDATPSVTVKHLSTKTLNQTPIPLPPLPEQHRIVSRIESLFAKLDEAKEKAQAVVDGFELRKSAILHKAFTGELTERWRKEHGVGLDSWKTVPFNDCIQKMQNGLAKRNGNIGKSYVVLRLANLTEDGFDTSDLREILLDEKEQESYSLAENDVIMVRVNGSKDIVGRQLLVPKIENWAFCDHIIRIHYQNNILPDYMIMFSKSDRYRAYVKGHMVSSAGQNTISRKGMANMVVPIPEEDEQRKIVRLLSIIFSKERQIKEAAEVVLADRKSVV